MARQGFLVACLVGLTAADSSSAQEVRAFLGNLHSHTGYSDGLSSIKPKDAYRRARENGLQFLAITEHNHSRCEDGAPPERRDGVMIGRDPSLYNGTDEDALIATADRMNEDGAFVTLYGQEFSSISKGNHINVFDIAEVISDRAVPNGRFDKLINEWVPSHPASDGRPPLVQFNHPFFRGSDPFELEYGKDDFGSDEEWVRRMGERARTIEILNGPGTEPGVTGGRPEEVAEAQYLKFLNLGFHLAPSGDQDNHYLNEGTETDARTGIITDGLTRAKLLAAIDARHVFATEDKNLRVIFRVDDHLCGDRLPPHEFGSELKVRFRIEDDDPSESQATYRVDVFSGTIRGGVARIVDTVQVTGNTTDGTIEDLRYTGGPQYVFFRVTQILEGEEGGDHDRAWTAPVWFDAPRTEPGRDADSGGVTTPPQPPAGPGSTPEEVTRLVASKRSSSYHLSLECLDAQRIKASNLVRGEAARQGRTLHPGCPRKVQ